MTPQADSSNPTLSKEKKSWDYDLLSDWMGYERLLFKASLRA